MNITRKLLDFVFVFLGSFCTDGIFSVGSLGHSHPPSRVTSEVQSGHPVGNKAPRQGDEAPSRATTVFSKLTACIRIQHSITSTSAGLRWVRGSRRPPPRGRVVEPGLRGPCRMSIDGKEGDMNLVVMHATPFGTLLCDRYPTNAAGLEGRRGSE